MTTNPERDNATGRALCTFSLAELHFGVDVLHVQEVIRYQPVRSVPLSPPVVVGLMNLRGQIITTCDLRRRMELPERSQEQTPVNIVLQSAEGPISLLVDNIGDVIEVGGQAFEPVPSTVTGAARDLIVGVHKLDSGLLLELSTERLISGLISSERAA